MEFLKNKNSFKRVYRSSFEEWAGENSNFITAELINRGIAFIIEHAEHLRASNPDILLDNRWHYLDKAKKESYKASLFYNDANVPYLNLTYSTFRHGNFSIKFDSKAALKDIWKNAKLGFPLTKESYKQQSVFKSLVKIDETPSHFLATDLKLWDSLEQKGESEYLQRKQLSSYSIPGMRFGDNFIAIKLINTKNDYQGLQKIFDDGQKRFTKGLKKTGHFALIGENELPPKIDTIHIAEGIATAASIFVSFKEPVFAAMDAGNLGPVAKELRLKYPKANIVIWADNDWQKADKVTKWGHVLGNTGLIKANSAAFVVRNARVCTPLFSQFPLEQIANATDFNDLFQIAGIDAILQTMPELPDLSLALFEEQRKYNKYTHGVLSAHQFYKGLRQTYNQRYLPDGMFDKKGIHLVRSAIGTGKTEVVERFLKSKPNQSVLFTTHLISLIESAAARLGLVSYNECDNFDLQIERRLAICLNSLGKLTAEGALRQYDVVVIDEIEQVLARLTTKIEQKPLIFSVFKHLLQHAETIICLDAHLSKATVDLMKSFCPKTPVTVHFNEYCPGEGKEIILHENAESVQMTALSHLEQGKKTYLAFNSKNEAFKTYSFIKAAFPSKRGLYISSDNAGDSENKSFFNAVNKASKRYDYVVCTPSVSTGVSIDNNHFDFVGGIFNAQINTANDCMQALGRIRNQAALHVFCEKRKGNFVTNALDIASKWQETHEHDLNLMNLNSDGIKILMNEDYERLCAQITLNRHRSYNDFFKQFVLLGLNDHVSFSYFEHEIEKETKKQIKDFKKACVFDEHDRICEQDLTINALKLITLAKKPRRTMQETRLYKKHQLVSFYNVHDNHTDTIKALSSIDEDGRLKTQILNMELALGDSQLAQSRFLKQLEEGAQFTADLAHFATIQQLYQQLLMTLKLVDDKNQLKISDYRYNKIALLNSGLIEWIEERRSALKGLLAIPAEEKLKAEPIRFVSTLLQKLGLKQKRVGRTDSGFYQVDETRLLLIKHLLERRQLGIEGKTLKLPAVKKKESPLNMNLITDCYHKIKALFLTELGAPLIQT